MRRVPLLMLGLLLFGLLLVRGLGGPQPLAAGATTCGEVLLGDQVLCDALA